MTKRTFIAVLFGGLASAFAQKTAKQKFYITGLGNDCTIPPIVAYGKDRLDALLHCCDGGGLTVWTEADYKHMREEIGKDFDKRCVEQYGKSEAAEPK